MSDARKEVAKKIIQLLAEHPDAWRMTEFTAECGEFRMWIANRPYADLSIDHKVRIGSFWQRAVIRKLLDHIACDRAINKLEAAKEQASPLDIDAVLRSLEKN